MMFKSKINCSRRIVCAMIALTLVTGLCGGCGWLAHGIAGGKRKVNVKAAYLGLEGKSVAVLVSADEYLLFEHPDAPSLVTTAVSSRIAGHVPNVTMMNPKDIITYQRNNPYWATVRDSKQIATLKVDRLVRIDLVQYRTHEPGNAHVWHGLITANVSVIEAESADPDNASFRTTIETWFPEDSKVGVLSSDDQTIQLGMLKLFAQQTAGLFHDHEIEQ